jgi:hypothetical protein
MSLENNQVENSNIDNDEISLKELVVKIKEWYVFLISKWKLIFLAGLIGGVFGLYISWSAKMIYKAELTFASEEDKGSVGGLGGALSNFGIDLGSSGGGAFSGPNLVELMKSRLLVEKTLLSPQIINGKITTLADYYIEINELRIGWKNNPNLKNLHYLPNPDRANFNLIQDSILKTIYVSLTSKETLNIIQKDKKISITTIEVNFNNELFAKLFCENLVKTTIAFYVEIKSRKAKLNVNILQRQADSIRKELNSAINEVAITNDNIFNLNPAFFAKRAPTTTHQIDVQANTVLLTSLLANLEISKVSLRKETPLIQVIDSPKLPLEKEKKSRLKYMILGGFLAGFLSVIYLIFSKLLRSYIS